MYSAEYHKKYYQEHKEKYREQGQARYQKHKEEIKAKNKRWREEHPERYKELTKRHRLRNQEKMVSRSRQWYINHKQRANVTQRKSKLKGYGLTPETYEAMLLKQNRLCLICGEEMKSPVVDHDHETGKVRGLLCRVCNAALGQFQESITILERAIQYLRNS